MVKMWQEEFEFRHVYGEEKDINWYGICHVYGKGKLYDCYEFRHVYDKEENIIDYGLEQGVESLLSCVPFSHLACGRGHGVDELLVFARLRDQWCKECPQEMITTLEGQKSLEGLWGLNFLAPIEEGLSWSLGFPLLIASSFRREVGF